MARKNNRSSTALANGTAHVGNEREKSETKAKDAEEQSPLLLVNDKTGSSVIRNTHTHDSIVEKAASRELAEANQEELPPEVVIPTRSICAFCHLHDEEDNMGNLFGPYVVSAPLLSNWPAFLCDPPAKNEVSTGNVLKIWMHSNCALWADGVKLSGAKIEDLEEKMAQFWRKKCLKCSKYGAAIDEEPDKTISEGTKNVAKKVKGGEKMSVLLTQAIVSGDDEKMDLLISQAANNSINPTVRDLPVAHVIPFIKLLEKRFRTSAAYDMTRVLRWIIPILHHHMPYLTSLPDLNSQLGSLLDWLNQRTSQMDKLLALQGKMSLIMEQMDRRSNPLSYASQEPQIVFHPDKEDSDSDLDDIDLDDSEAGDSDNSWWDEDNDEETKEGDVDMENDDDSDGDDSSDDDAAVEAKIRSTKRPRTADSDESSEDSDDEDEMDIG